MVALLATSFVLTTSPLQALAAPAVDIIFTATTGGGTTGGNSITASSGDTLTVTINLTAESAGISSYGVSIEFDTDLIDELNIVSVTELLPAGFDFNLTPGPSSTQESSGVQKGNILTLEAATFQNGPVSTTFAIGTIEFLVTNNIATDGLDIFSGLFNVSFDGVFNNNQSMLSPTFNSAMANASVIPALSKQGMAIFLLLAAGATLAIRYRETRAVQ